VVRRLAGMLETARRDGGPGMVVDSDVAARFADAESAAADRRLNIRYPDIWIRDCEPYDVNTVREHILLVVEVISMPISMTSEFSTRPPVFLGT
jgi:hypothetical protein